jgi:hypothetical protein
LTDEAADWAIQQRLIEKINELASFTSKGARGGLRGEAAALQSRAGQHFPRAIECPDVRLSHQPLEATSKYFADGIQSVLTTPSSEAPATVTFVLGHDATLAPLVPLLCRPLGTPTRDM